MRNGDDFMSDPSTRPVKRRDHKTKVIYKTKIQYCIDGSNTEYSPNKWPVVIVETGDKLK